MCSPHTKTHTKLWHSHTETGASPESCPCLFSVRQCRVGGGRGDRVQLVRASAVSAIFTSSFLQSPGFLSPMSLSDSCHGRLAVSLPRWAESGITRKKKEKQKKTKRKDAGEKKGFLITLNNTANESRALVRSASGALRSSSSLGVRANTKGISADLPHEGWGEIEVWQGGLRGERRKVRTY